MTDPQAKTLTQFVTDQLVQKGKMECEVIDMLVEKGADRKEANEIVDKIARHIEETESKGAWKSIVLGLILTIAGIISTVMLFSAGWVASVTFALIAAGVVFIIKGLKKYNIL